MINFKIKLSAARVNAGLTQEEVARALKVSKTTLVNWEKGRTDPSFAVICTLSDLYGVPVELLAV